MNKHLLEADSIQKYFGDKLIISDVYLKCETTDIIALFGRNGSEKSTLLKIIFGIISADFKFIRIDGVIKNKTHQLLQDISYLSQENFIPNHFSVKTAISLAITKDKISDFYTDEIIQAIQNKQIGHLSGGELRYLEIKLILSNDSKFALLDEPYNGLSPIMIEKINLLILEKSTKKGIILSDHNYENVLKIANQLLLMKEGKVYHLKDKSELIEKGYLTNI